MFPFEKLVSPSGELNSELIVKMEEISNQKNVDRLSLIRFWIEEHESLKSYIFKPSKESFPVQFEIWFQDKIASRMKDVHVPTLMAHHVNEEDRVFWMIFEDIGIIEPSFEKSVRIDAAKKIAEWHSLPVDVVPEDYKTFMPYIDESMPELLTNRIRYEKLLLDIDVPPYYAASVFNRLEEMNGVFPCRKVVCHGDYHCLNILDTKQGLYILDWEFIQVNASYWDLYTLLDMATPRYRIQIDKEIRDAALHAYFEQSKPITGSWPDFRYGYHLFAFIYTAGILGLIADDLEAGTFDRETLLIQKREVTEIIRDCLEVVAAS